MYISGVGETGGGRGEARNNADQLTELCHNDLLAYLRMSPDILGSDDQTEGHGKSSAAPCNIPVPVVACARLAS